MGSIICIPIESCPDKQLIASVVKGQYCIYSYIPTDYV